MEIWGWFDRWCEEQLSEQERGMLAGGTAASLYVGAHRRAAVERVLAGLLVRRDRRRARRRTAVGQVVALAQAQNLRVAGLVRESSIASSRLRPLISWEI